MQDLRVEIELLRSRMARVEELVMGEETFLSDEDVSRVIMDLERQISREVGRGFSLKIKEVQFWYSGEGRKYLDLAMQQRVVLVYDLKVGYTRIFRVSSFLKFMVECLKGRKLFPEEWIVLDVKWPR